MTKKQPQELPLTADLKELIECYKICDVDNKEELLFIARLKAAKKTNAIHLVPKQLSQDIL